MGFQNLGIHKLSLKSSELPQKLLARSVQLFRRLLNTIKQKKIIINEGLQRYGKRGMRSALEANH